MQAAIKKQLSEDNKAVQALGEFGPVAKEAVPALVERLHEDRFHERKSIAFALAHIGPEAKEAVPALIDVLRNDNGDTRAAAAYALERIGPAAAPAVPALCQLLRTGDADDKRCAIGALGEIGPAAADGVALLVKELDSESNGGGRWKVADSLGKIGPKAREAVPALVAAPRNPAASVRVSAAWALWRIDGRKQPLLDALGEDLESIRKDAAIYLGRLGPEAKAAVPGLVKALEDEDKQVREAAAEALGLIGVREVAVPALRRTMNDEKVGMRIKSAVALWKLEKSPEMLTLLANELASAPDGTGFDHRADVADTLRGFGPEARAVGPALRECIASSPAYPREKALYALQETDPKLAEEVWSKMYDLPKVEPGDALSPGTVGGSNPDENQPNSRTILVVGLIALVAGGLFVCVLLVIRKKPAKPQGFLE